MTDTVLMKVKTSEVQRAEQRLATLQRAQKSNQRAAEVVERQISKYNLRSIMKQR